MKKITMFDMLTAIQKSPSPVGAIFLSRELEASSGTIGRMLKEAEDSGYLVRVSNKGRVLTDAGAVFLEEQETRSQLLENAKAIIDMAGSSDCERVRDILEVRLLIEPYTVRRAAEHINPDNLEELRTIDFEQRYVITKGNSGSEEDLRFHLKLAEMGGNRTLHHILQLVLTENSIYEYFAKVSNDQQLGTVVDHKEILQALAKRDGELAAKAMEKHIRNLIKITKE